MAVSFCRLLAGNRPQTAPHYMNSKLEDNNGPGVRVDA
ncbi:hypothetical protein POX_e07036 [Penicillium oxalicum]|nr:hypothetical protein POX_e07036 [Penicillium oxalicum]KAI2789010.1 hypothetical protein POX_e07036 [Penicillium oxalicum]